MEKDFDGWNSIKKSLDAQQRTLHFREGEVWWCSIGQNIGEESFGKGSNFRRPVLVLKKLSRNSCIILPITSKMRIGSWYHELHIGSQCRWAMIHQIRFISVNRLSNRQFTLAFSEFEELKKSVAVLLGLISSPSNCSDQWDNPNME